MAIGFAIELEFRNVAFCRTRETGELGKTPSSKDKKEE